MLHPAQQLRILIVALLPLLCAGCFSERSFPVRDHELKCVRIADAEGMPLRVASRQWVDQAHAQLRDELPTASRNALTSRDLGDGRGGARDIYRHFGINPDGLDSLVTNYAGVSISARVTPSGAAEPRWPGFSPVQIPVTDGLQLSAQLAAPTGEDIERSFIIVTHGLFGQQAGSRQRDLSAALRAFGHHVLSVDMRGHGETARRFPNQPCTFGLDEPRDLLAVARWLRETQGARRVGLVGYSIGAHHALMAAWLDGGGELTIVRPSPLVSTISSPSAAPAFDAGVLAISPTLNLIAYANEMETRATLFGAPVKTMMQRKVEQRLRELGAKPSWRAWDLMEIELRRSRWMGLYANYALLLDDQLKFIDFCDLAGPAVGAARMERIRVPVLILMAADDPLRGTAQAVADVFGRTRNDNCGVILLREGGHGGFPALSRSYYYSLLRSFFDPASGPIAGDCPANAVRHASSPSQSLGIAIP